MLKVQEPRALALSGNDVLTATGLEPPSSPLSPGRGALPRLLRRGAADQGAGDPVTAAPAAHETNVAYRAFQQVRFDNNALTYFINSDGNLVARYNGPAYDYSGGPE